MAIKRKVEADIVIDSKKLKRSIDQGQEKIGEALLQESLNVVSSNLFRVLPHCSVNVGIQFGDSFYINKKNRNNAIMSIEDPSWPKLELVYEFISELIDSPQVDARLLSSCIKPSFVLKLMGLFHSEDGRERDALFFVLLRLYMKSDAHHRKLIRKFVFNEFYSLATSANEKHNGLAELLLFLTNIVDREYNDFGVQQEFSVFVVQGLIPLFKSNWLALFYPDLNCFVEIIVKKNSKIAVTLMQGLLRHWPVAGSSREYFFLQGVETVLWEAQPIDLQDIVTPLFRRIADCLSSPHYRVAEKSLSLFTIGGNTELLITQNLEVILPIIFIDLELNAKNHWHSQTQKLAHDVGKYLLDIEPEMYGECRMLWRLWVCFRVNKICII